MNKELSRELSRYASIIDSYLGEKLRGSPEHLYKAATHLIKAGGKRVRPAVTLATAKMLGGSVAMSRAIPLAASVEAIHNFSLVHDDIMDRDEYRRGVPTVHTIWGEATAILAGDLLYAYAFHLAGEAGSRGLQPGYLVEAYKVLAEASVKLSEGQGYDMAFEATWDVGVRDYLNMVYLKTGALIEAAARLGAIAAESDLGVVSALGDYGRLVGIAFQIRDDILGIFGDPGKTGKPVYSDLRRGKKTLLLVYTVEKIGREEVERLLSQGMYEDVARLIRESGALSYAEKLARGYMEEAISILDGLAIVEDEGAREFLRSLARFVVERDR